MQANFHTAGSASMLRSAHSQSPVTDHSMTRCCHVLASTNWDLSKINTTWLSNKFKVRSLRQCAQWNINCPRYKTNLGAVSFLEANYIKHMKAMIGRYYWILYCSLTFLWYFFYETGPRAYRKCWYLRKYSSELLTCGSIHVHHAEITQFSQVAMYGNPERPWRTNCRG